MSLTSHQAGQAFLTLKDAATYANCCTATIRRAVHRKELPHHRFGTSETRGKIFIRACHALS